MSKEEILKIVQATKEELGLEGIKKEMGKFMGAVMKKVGGNADGNTVREVIQGFLN
jgi:uncharacterized protein YqeY